MIDLRHKIGQLLIMGFSGCDIDSQSPIAQSLQHDGLGGVLLFDFDVATKCQGKNLQNKDQIKLLVKKLRHFSSASAAATFLPLFTALDYEGGTVDRLAKIEGCMTTMSALEQATLSDKALYDEASKMALTLSDLGFNLNFAPVVDLNLNQQQGIIGKRERSFSDDPTEVIRAAKLFVDAFRDNGIVCAYKHFPGHGSALGDTHEGFVDVTPYFSSEELVPYKELLKNANEPAMIMTAHVINRHLDPSGLPATLSHSILTDLLRKQIGFEGVTISDDLQMQAISDHYALDDVLRLTLTAGADMLIFANQLGNISAKEVIDRIEQLVNSGAVDAHGIEQSYQRVARLKQSIKTI